MNICVNSIEKGTTFTSSTITEMSIETIIQTQPSLDGKLSQVMPILAEIARQNNLKLSKISHLFKAKRIAEISMANN